MDDKSIYIKLTFLINRITAVFPKIKVFNIIYDAVNFLNNGIPRNCFRLIDKCNHECITCRSFTSTKNSKVKCLCEFKNIY
jgi:hypothetical protein